MGGGGQSVGRCVVELRGWKPRPDKALQGRTSSLPVSSRGHFLSVAPGLGRLANRRVRQEGRKEGGAGPGHSAAAAGVAGSEWTASRCQPRRWPITLAHSLVISMATAPDSPRGVAPSPPCCEGHNDLMWKQDVPQPETP